MIVVRVELHSAITGQQTEIARMMINNVGGTVDRGDYRCRTFRGRTREALDRAMSLRTLAITREGSVQDHPRRAQHVWNLVAKALSGMGYGAG